MKPKSQSEFVPRDTEESEFLDLADFEGVAISVETVKIVHAGLARLDLCALDLFSV